MKKKYVISLIVVGILGLVTLSTVFLVPSKAQASCQFDVASFAKKNCMMCHKSGKRKLMGKFNPDNFVERIKVLQSGKGNKMMVKKAKKLSPEQIKALAQYFSQS